MWPLAQTMLMEKHDCHPYGIWASYMVVIDYSRACKCFLKVTKPWSLELCLALSRAMYYITEARDAAGTKAPLKVSIAALSTHMLTI